MRRFLADEDFKDQIVDALQRRLRVDILHARAAGLRARSDDEVLARAAAEDRVVLSHDRSTMTVAAATRIVEGLPFSGLVIVPWQKEVGSAVRALESMIAELADDEWSQIRYVPSR